MLQHLAEGAACTGLPTEMFFIEFTDLTDRRYRKRVIAAKAVCSACPVRLACRDYAIGYPEAYGIWGGTTPRERQLHRSRRSATA
jgi:WhiB family redox-sensing transcriptional regulator